MKQGSATQSVIQLTGHFDVDAKLPMLEVCFELLSESKIMFKLNTRPIFKVMSKRDR